MARRAALAIAIVSAVTVLFFTRGEVSTNPASRFATMDALVHDGTFAIDHSVFADTIDKVHLDGRFYSSKPPVLSTFGAGLYFALHRATGLSFRTWTRGWAIYVVTVVLMLGAHVLLLVYGYRLLAAWEPRPAVLVPAFAALALGYLGVGYATTVNNHTPAAAAALAAFYHAFAARRLPAARKRDWLAAGAFAGLAPTLDLAAMFVSAAVGLYLLTYDWRRTVTLFVPAALPAVALHLALTFVVSGGIVPIYLRPELYRYPGSYWNQPTNMDALDEPRSVYLFHMLVGHHGLFAMTPLFSLALWSIGRHLVAGTARRPEALVVGGSLAVLIAFYTATTKNYGGDCVGFRWLLVIMPLLFVFVATWLAAARRRGAYAAFAVLFALGVPHVVDALREPWRTSLWQRWILPGS